MSERRGADGGPPMTLGPGLRRWFLRPPRPHGEVIEDRTVGFLELFYDLVYVVLVGQSAHTLAENVSVRSGTGLFTYPTKENAGKSPATLAAWHVEDIEATARALRAKGVALEDYDLPGLKTVRGIATLPGAKALWFKDPDGNILNVFERL